MRHLSLVIYLCVFLLPLKVVAQIQAVGLMPGMAILEVDGKQVTIKVGQTRHGVKLIKADSQEAVIEVDGKKEVLQLGLSLTEHYAESKKSVVRLRRETSGHYFTSVRINGGSMRMLVDTGATHIALSSRDAKRLGINYASGQKGRSSTAGGMVTSYTLRLNEVQVGAIKRYNVITSVIEGSFPETPLLGMSFLNQVKMHEDQGMLVLTDQ